MLIELPPEYSFSIDQQDSRSTFAAVVYLLHDNAPKRRRYNYGHTPNAIGRVILERTSDGRYQTHSSLEPKYRGKGLGALTYAAAIDFALTHGYHVRCSYNRSDSAAKVWSGRTLRQFFRIKSRRITWGSLPRQSKLIYHAYPKDTP